ncbi:MAG: hypothetical protein IPH45_03520 [Bacteroidales bacterium]|nr:hypothetical protein [Bacteroidales bacterium]
MNNAGSYIPGVPTDFAGTSRSNPPDIGAYEFAIDPVVVTSSATAVTYQSATVQGMVNAANYDV